MKFLVFDKGILNGSTTFLDTVIEAGVGFVPVMPLATSCAIAGLLAKLEEPPLGDGALVFAHIEDKDWSRLVHGLAKGQYAIRFSAGFLGISPTTPGKGGGFGFTCRKSRTNVQVKDVASLVTAFSDPTQAKDLCNSKVPPKLLSLLALELVDKLASLDILLQCWAADPGSFRVQDFVDAMELAEARSWDALWQLLLGFTGLRRPPSSPPQQAEPLVELLALLQDSPCELSRRVEADMQTNWSIGLVSRASIELRQHLAKVDG